MQSLRVVIILALVTAVAHADRHLGVHVGGGLEGGLITGKPRPDAVGELGVAGDLINAHNGIGIGFSYDRIERPSSPGSENKLDLMLRVRGKNESRMGVGMGLRWLEPDPSPLDGLKQPLWQGFDWIRIDSILPLGASTHATIESYLAWTFGCYVGTSGPREERMTSMRDVSCGNTLTTSYVVGVQGMLR